MSQNLKISLVQCTERWKWIYTATKTPVQEKTCCHNFEFLILDPQTKFTVSVQRPRILFNRFVLLISISQYSISQNVHDTWLASQFLDKSRRIHKRSNSTTPQGLNDHSLSSASRVLVLSLRQNQSQDQKQSRSEGTQIELHKCITIDEHFAAV